MPQRVAKVARDSGLNPCLGGIKISAVFNIYPDKRHIMEVVMLNFTSSGAKRIKKWLYVFLISSLFFCFSYCGPGKIGPHPIPEHIPRPVRKELKKALSVENAESIKGAYKLGAMGKQVKKAVPFLILILNDKNVHLTIRSRAARTLGYVKDHRAIDELIKGLADINLGVKMASASALGNMKTNRAIQPLIKALKQGYAGVRMAAAMALGRIGNPQAVEPLAQRLDPQQEENPGVRMAVATALGDIRDKDAVPVLIEALKEKDPGIRMNAAGALGKIKSKKAVPALIVLLDDKNPNVRSNAVWSLQAISRRTYGPAKSNWVTWWQKQKKK
jgi:hypothetical protein